MATSINRGKQQVSIHPLADITSTGVSQLFQGILPAGCFRLGNGFSYSLTPTPSITTDNERVIGKDQSLQIILRQDRLNSGNLLIKAVLPKETTLLFPCVDYQKENSRLGNNQPFLVKITFDQTDEIFEVSLPITHLVSYKKFYLVANWVQDLKAGSSIFASFELKRVDSFQWADSPYKDIPKNLTYFDPITKTSTIVVASIIFQPAVSGPTNYHTIRVDLEEYSGSYTNVFQQLFDYFESLKSEFNFAYQYTSQYNYIGANQAFLNNQSIPCLVVYPSKAGFWLKGRYLEGLSRYYKFYLDKFPLPQGVDPTYLTIPTTEEWASSQQDYRFDLLSVIDYQNNDLVFEWQTQYGSSPSIQDYHWDQNGKPVCAIRRTYQEYHAAQLAPSNIIHFQPLASNFGLGQSTQLKVQKQMIIPVEV